MNDAELGEVLALIEERWATTTLDPRTYGGQIQPGTTWNSGLRESEIAAYEAALCVRFPDDLRRLFALVNGTHPLRIDLRGGEEPPRFVPGVYVYPRDLECVREQVRYAEEERSWWERELADMGVRLKTTDKLVPFFAHRSVVCSEDPTASLVLSIHQDDAIVYGDSLIDYLRNEFLRPDFGDED